MMMIWTKVIKKTKVINHKYLLILFHKKKDLDVDSNRSE